VSEQGSAISTEHIEAQIKRHETKTRRTILLAMTVSLFLLLVLAAMYVYYATEQRYKALSALKLATEAKNEATAAQSLVKRTSPVLAVSPDHTRTISESGWLLNRSGYPFVDLTEEPVEFAQFSPDGLTAFVVPTVGQPLVIESVTGKVLSKFPGVSEVYSAAFSQDSRSLLVASSDGVFRYRNGEVTKVDIDSPNPVRFVAASPYSNLLVLGSDHDDILISKDDGKSIVPLQTNIGGSWTTNPVRAIAFSADNRSIIIFHRSGEGFMLDLNDRSVTSEFSGLTIFGLRPN
jgi:WD40 repeat protein